MGTRIHEALRVAQETASANIRAILGARGMTPADLARAAQTSGAVVKKTIYNTLNPTHKPKLESLAQVADLLGVPLWTLLIPGLCDHEELLKPGALRELASVVENYLNSTPARRIEIEETARVMARRSSLEK